MTNDQLIQMQQLIERELERLRSAVTRFEKHLEGFSEPQGETVVHATYDPAVRK